jgi:hypothetical protein
MFFQDQGLKRLFSEYPQVLEKIMFIPIADKADSPYLSHYCSINKKLVVKYFNEPWVFHELAHIACASPEEMVQKNYGYSISNDYSYSELKHELLVFHHQVNLLQKYSCFNFKKSSELVKKQIDDSLIEKNKAVKLKSLISTSLTVFNQEGTIKRILLNLDKLPK